MATTTTEQGYVWMDGELVPWADATVHASKLGWSTIAAVFEGVKAYWNPERERLFGWQFLEHYRRFALSMRLMHMQVPFTPEDFASASVELLQANGAQGDSYVFPLAFHADADWFGTMTGQRVSVLIRTFPFESRLGSGGAVRACVSSWTRLSDNVMSPRIKCVSNYQNGRMALLEANQRGFEQPILLNDRGKVAEGSASCVFVVRNGVLVTPSVTDGVLESITRSTLLRLAADALGLQATERAIDRTELYAADEVFFCGTGAEIMPVGWVDGYQIGDGTPGPITRRVEQLYHDLVRGRDERYPEWRTAIPVAVPA